MLVAGVLGLRWGEAVGLRVRDIDFLRRTVTVAQIVEETAGPLAIVKEAKTAAGLRTLAAPRFLIGELAQHLAEHRTGVASDPEALVFVGPRGGVLRRRFGERTFAPAVVKAGLDPSLTFHGLRHAAITTMVELGVHPRVMQGRAGHATSKLTMELYAHVTESADRQAAELLDRHYRDQPPGGKRGTGCQNYNVIPGQVALSVSDRSTTFGAAFKPGSRAARTAAVAQLPARVTPHRDAVCPARTRNRWTVVDAFFRLAPHSEPVVLSPAVDSVFPTAGTRLDPGSTVDAHVIFDAAMSTKSTDDVITAEGCGVSGVSDLRWNGDGTPTAWPRPP